MAYEYYRKYVKNLTKPFNKYENWNKQAKLLKLSKPAIIRLGWFIYYETTAKKNVSLTCRHFGIARKTFYKWDKKFDKQNLRTLESVSTAPKKTRQKEITTIEEQRIIKLRKEHIRWGKMKIQKLYKNIYGEEISSWKIQYTIQKYKLYYNPQKNERLINKRKRSQQKKRITELKKKPASGHLIALDTKIIYWKGLKRYILTGIDTVSKIAFARMYTSKSSKNAADFLRRMFYLLDGSVLNTLNDNGSEFHKEVIKACQELGISQYWSRVKTPTDNPIIERFNRTLKEEFLDLGNFNSNTVIFNKNLTEWLVEYTFVRPHQSLNYETPWIFYQSINKVLPMYPSRTDY